MLEFNQRRDAMFSIFLKLVCVATLLVMAFVLLNVLAGLDPLGSLKLVAGVIIFILAGSFAVILDVLDELLESDRAKRREEKRLAKIEAADAKMATKPESHAAPS